MAEAKKPVKPIVDVAHPGTTAPSATSKPVITKRSILQDPMVTASNDGAGAGAKPSAPELSNDNQPVTGEVEKAVTSKAKIITPTVTTEEPELETKPADVQPETKPEPAAETSKAEPEAKPEAVPAATETPKADQPSEEAASTDVPDKAAVDEEAAAKAEAEHDAAIQKLVDSHNYFLPINALEKRKSKRFVALGILLALLLTVAWVDIALDAGLIQLGSIKPVTHFFSN